MDDYVLLDILLGLIVALFAAIGFWRGAAKEVVVTAGIFAGAALASSWAVPWGSDLADLVDVRTEVARLLVAATALLAASLILGYGGSALVRSPDVGLAGRLLGAALAAINGALLLHYCLWFIERFLTGEGAQEALDQSEVSRVLLRQFGWLLIGAGGLVAMVIAAGLWLGRRRGMAPLVPATGETEAVPAVYYDANNRQRPARLPRGADGGKYEPVARGYDSASERYAADTPAAGQTIPLPPVDAVNLAYGGGRGAPRTDSYTGDEWHRDDVPARPAPFDAPREDASNGHIPTAGHSSFGTPSQAADGDSRPETGANGHTPLVDSSAYSWVQRLSNPGWDPASTAPSSDGNLQQPARACRVCTAELGPDDSFCPRCGTSAG